jgi:indolepyruvate ferredoxin oxidoreductase beta subunit
MKEQRMGKDPFNLIITGVGGQGTVMASRVISNMLSLQGYKITIGETFGASQRGGPVMSHIRVSESGTWSPQIPKGQADLVVALEPVETFRVLTVYGNPDVCVLANIHPTYPVGVIAGDLNYPILEEIEKTLHTLAGRVLLLDATKEAVDLGNPILSNIIMVGAVCALGILPVGLREFESAIRNMIPAKHQDLNVAAFKLGQTMSSHRIEEAG